MADVRYGIATFQIPNATGTFNVTAAALSGLTPKAAIFFLGEAPSDNTATSPNWQQIIGWAVNGGSSQSAGAQSQDNQGNTTNSRRQRAIPICDLGSLQVSVSAWIADGMTLNVTTTAGGPTRQGWVLFIAGSGVNAAAGTQDLGTGTSALTQTPGFAADLVFTLGVNRTSSTATASTALMCHGVAKNEGGGSVVQRCVAWGEANTVASGGQPAMQVRDNCSLMSINTASGASLADANIGNFTATQFDITPSASFGSVFIYWLALSLDGHGATIIDFTAPVATGNQTYGALGFQPTCVLGVATPVTALNTATFNVAAASGFSTFGFDFSNQQVNVSADDSAADPTDCNNAITSTLCLAIPSGATVLSTQATFVSFGATDFTINYSAVGAGAGVGWFLALEGVPAGVGDIQLQQGVVKFAVSAAGDVRLQQGIAKFSVAAMGDLRLQQGVVKFAVRTYPIQRIAKTVPPTDITLSRAPYIKRTRLA